VSPSWILECEQSGKHWLIAIRIISMQ
jgi:hypothetical protein